MVNFENGQSVVTISEKEYEGLLEKERFLEALRGCGVDNWDGYDYAIEMIEEWDKEEIK